MPTESFFTQASLAYLASAGAGKDGKTYSMKPTDGTGDFTFSRGSNLSATRVGADGLIEKGRENLLLQSNQFDTTWFNVRSTETGGQTDKDGGSTAWLLESTDASTSYVQQNVSSSGVQTFSVIAKKGTTDYIYLLVFGSNLAGQYFDLNNGTLATSVYTTIDASIEDLGGGWYRCSVIFESNVTHVTVYPADSGTSSVSAVGSNIYIQDSQLEIGLAATEVISTGATTGKAGLLEDEPRFDYSGGATCPSLLLEPSRTQLVGQTEYFGGYTNSNSTDEPNATTSPEGLTNATSFLEAATTGQHKLFTSLTFDGSSTYSFSIFAKSNGRDLYVDTQNSNEWGGRAWFDLTAGTANAVLGTADIEDFGNGWYRCIVTGASTLAGGNLIELLTSDGSTNSTTGDITKGVYIYGAQLEEGSYPTSYIPNHSGGTITRGADASSVTGVSSLIGQTEGTIFIETFSDDSKDGATRIQLSSGTSTTDWIFLSCPEPHLNLNKPRVFINNGGSNQVNSYGSSLSSGNHKYALAYKENDVVLYVDGVLQISDTSASIPTCDKLTICGIFPTSNNTAERLNKHKQVLLFKERLSNSDLETLTTI